RAAVANEEEVRRHLAGEVDSVVRGLATDLKVSETQMQSLERQTADVERRLSGLAGMRARYNNLVAETQQCSAALIKAQKDLGDARGTQAAAQTSSLITRVDHPDAGNGPIGPGRIVIVSGGF